MLRKIADISQPCLNREHNPPGHIVLQPGVYEHICPGCGKKQTFTVHRIYNSCVYDDGGSTYPSWCYTHDHSFPHDLIVDGNKVQYT